jgi:hypothetical protein
MYPPIESSLMLEAWAKRCVSSLCGAGAQVIASCHQLRSAVSSLGPSPTSHSRHLRASTGLSLLSYLGTYLPMYICMRLAGIHITGCTDRTFFH